MEITARNAVIVSLVESLLGSFFFPHVFPSKTLTSFFIAFLACNISILLVYRLVVYPFILSPLRHLPQARGFLPIVGHEITMFQRPPGEPNRKAMLEIDNDGLILVRGFLHTNKLIVTSPAALADVLVHKAYDMEKPPWTRGFLRKFLGDGLLVAEGDVYVALSYS